MHDVRQTYDTQEAWLRDWEGLKRRSLDAPGVDWTSSWFAAGPSRLYCLWEAPDPQAIRACFVAEELKRAPIREIDEVAHVDPAWLVGAA
jgi:hypothetical protein